MNYNTTNETNLKRKRKHDENRQQVCAPCGVKITGKVKLVLKGNQISLLQQLHPNFNLENDIYPTGICRSCYSLYSKHEKGDEVNFPKFPNYNDMILPRETRQNTSPECNCYICITARDKTRKPKYVFKSDLPVVIERGTGLLASEDNTLATEQVKEKRISLTICRICKQETGVGIPHKCTPTKAAINLAKYASDLPEKNRDQVISNLIKEKAGNQSLKDAQLEISTQGAKLSIVVNPESSDPKQKLSHDDMRELQSKLGLSNSRLKDAGHWIRKTFGRKTIQPYFRESTSEALKEFDDLYQEEVLPFHTTTGTETAKPLIYAEAETLLDFVCNKRNLTGDLIIKLYMDGGQGTFKLCLSIFPKSQGQEYMSKPGRSTYQDPGDEFKLTSVKRVIILAIVSDIPETHHNIQLIFDKTKVNNIPFKFCVDYKVLLLTIGMQNALATYPCPFCYIHKDDMKNLEEYIETADKPDARTFGSLKEDFKNFKEEFQSKRKSAKFSNNVVNSSLIEEDDFTTVLEKCPIDELHVLEGITNHIFFDGLVKKIGYEDAMKWPKALHVTSVLYHGEKFEGNGCRTLCRNADMLRNTEIMGLSSLWPIEPYVSAFQSFDKLISACFGSHSVEDEIPRLLENFTKCYMGLEISVTLKAHVLIGHLDLCLLNLQGEGLGLFSTQSGESIHKVFEKEYWARYKVKDPNHPDLGKRMLQAVKDCSLKHI